MNEYMRKHIPRFLVYEPKDAKDFVELIHKLLTTLANEMVLEGKNLRKTACTIIGESGL